jgi:PAS domain S-box-containing protein
MVSVGSREQRSRDGISSRDAATAAREWFELTAAMSPFIVLVVDAGDFRVVHANAAYAAAFGEDLEAMMGRSVTDTAPADELPGMRERMLAVRDGTLRQWTLTRRFQRRDGSTFMAEVGVSGLADETGTVRYMLVQGRPLDDVPKMDPDETGRLLAFMTPLLRRSADLVVVLDVTGRTVWAGNSLRDWLGDDAVRHGCDIFDAVEHDDAPRLADFVVNAARSTDVAGPCRVRMGTGPSLREVEVFGGGLPADPTLVFALVRRSAADESRVDSPRERELERSMREIAKTAAEVLGESGDDLRGSLPPEVDMLTAREREILLLLLRGHRVATIASRLYLAPGTIRNHLSRIFQKLGVSSQAELLELLHDTGRPPVERDSDVGVW